MPDLAAKEEEKSNSQRVVCVIGEVVVVIALGDGWTLKVSSGMWGGAAGRTACRCKGENLEGATVK